MRVFVSVTLVALLAFLTVATFDLYLSSATTDHHAAGCPLMVGQATLCANSLLAHLDYWQDVFVAVVVNTFALFALVILVVVVLPFRLPDKRRARIDLCPPKPDRPPLFQELFSQGILHPKAP